MVTKLGKSNAFSLFGASGTMEQLEKVHISRGTKIYAFGYAMNEQFFVVYDDEMNCVEICNGNPDEIDEYDLNRYFSPLHHLEDETRPISALYGIGFYYDESDEVISDEIIEKSLKRAENLKNLKKQIELRKEEESRNRTESLKKEYGKILEQCGCYDHKTCGKNIRRELKLKFPTTKFSVRYSSFSGGDSYDISWTDGPTQESVDNVVKKYADKHPDEYSMGDYWDYVPSEFNHLYGGVSYVMTQRNISEETLQIAEKTLAEKGVTEENYKSYVGDDKILFDMIHYGYLWDFKEAIRCYAHKIYRSPVPKESKREKSEKVEISGDFQIIDYSEKAVAVIGDTKNVKNELKKLGGRFNPRLSCGAGWIFSKKKESELRELLS